MCITVLVKWGHAISTHYTLNWTADLWAARIWINKKDPETAQTVEKILVFGLISSPVLTSEASCKCTSTLLYVTPCLSVHLHERTYICEVSSLLIIFQKAYLGLESKEFVKSISSSFFENWKNIFHVGPWMM